MTVLNFVLNSRLTFASGPSDWQTKARFAGVAGVATVLNNMLFWVGHVWLGFSDFTIIAVDALCIAIFTFATHRFFTFHPDPWRFLRSWRAVPVLEPAMEAIALDAEAE
jgi:putative flippase GtrA